MRCAYCQDRQIAQWPKDHLPKTLDKGPHDEGPEPVRPQLEAIDARVAGEPVTRRRPSTRPSGRGAASRFATR
jgi:hypothetical protein